MKWGIDMKQITAGILAHVDAGKTTLSEGLLYQGGSIRKMGRVDNGDAFLDTDQMEKKRGITIFSKQAQLVYKDTKITLLDTPGHVDFSAEMERTMQVLDYAILVISASDGAAGHTKTLWRLLQRYEIPVFLFINKMDQPDVHKESILKDLKEQLSDACIDFSDTNVSDFMENAAMEDERAMEQFLETGVVEKELLQEMIAKRSIFPCFFGSALKMQGVEQFLNGFDTYTMQPEYGNEFGMRVFKIARDDANNRLTYLKVTGGSLKVKDVISSTDAVTYGEDAWEEKINQIRIYSGSKYETVNYANAGTICAVTGLEHTRAGQGFGAEADVQEPLLEPVLHFKMILPDEIKPAQILPKLYQLEEEEPQLHVLWNETLKEIQVQIMGEVQIEVLKTMIAERYGVEVEFGQGKIVYKETIANPVEGVGHFEPLRHYAEVHLLLEPAECGSGIEVAMDCSEDLLSLHWQKLIASHLREREHNGVLTGSAVTDLKITVINGRAHQKHTESGDFRQAAYRALRQGLMKAQSVLLEPYYEFRIELPNEMVGRAILDIEKMNGKFEGPYQQLQYSVLRGIAPAVCIAHYQRELMTYTKGMGKISLNFCGYYPCHNSEEVIEEIGYDPTRDAANPADSVFCAHGAGFLVPWNEVENYMHVECKFEQKREQTRANAQVFEKSTENSEHWIDLEEIDAILERTYHANKNKNGKAKRWKTAKKVIEPSLPKVYTQTVKDTKEHYLLVDGYNIIFAWENLRTLAEVNIDSAKDALLDILCNYQGIRKCHLIVVFDAYRVKGHKTELFDYHNIHVVYTKEAETADAYIEKFAHENGRKFHVTVATSDGLEQIIIMGQGCTLFSAREFEREVEAANGAMREILQNKKDNSRNYFIKEALERKTDK